MADIARRNAQRGGNCAAATRIVTIVYILADATQTIFLNIHELKWKLTDREENRRYLYQLFLQKSDAADLQAVMDNADQHNQVVRNAQDNFKF